MIMLLSGPPGVGKTLTAESGMCDQAISQHYTTFFDPQKPRVG